MKLLDSRGIECLWKKHNHKSHSRILSGYENWSCGYFTYSIPKRALRKEIVYSPLETRPPYHNNIYLSENFFPFQGTKEMGPHVRSESLFLF